MLFGLMVVSAAFVVSGFYAWVARARRHARRCARRCCSRSWSWSRRLLSALLTNDVVVVAMTPLLVSITLSRGLNPVPFLLAFCFAANTGSAGTIIGSPQNMIAAQGLGLSFTGFLRVAALPALLSLPIVWGGHRAPLPRPLAAAPAPRPAPPRAPAPRSTAGRPPRRRR